MVELTGKQKRYLRSLGHHLEPALMVGASGVGEGVAQELERGLVVHELVKVKLGQGGGDRKQVAAALAEASGAALVQVLGRTILLYRPAKKRKIQLP